MTLEEKIIYEQTYRSLLLPKLLDICKEFVNQWTLKDTKAKEAFSCLLIVIAEKCKSARKYDEAIKFLNNCLLVQYNLGDNQGANITKFEIVENYYDIYKETKKLEDIEKVYGLVYTAKDEIYQQLRKTVTEDYREALKIWTEKFDAEKTRGLLALTCEKYLTAEDYKGAGIIANVIAYNYYRQYQINKQDAYYIEQAIHWMVDAMKYDPEYLDYKSFYNTLKIEYADFLLNTEQYESATKSGDTHTQKIIVECQDQLTKIPESAPQNNKRERQEEKKLHDETNPYNTFSKKTTLEKNKTKEEHKSFQK